VNPEVPRRRRRRRGPDPALISGTSTEFFGRKPLPRAVKLRPLLFLLGPAGVGKSTVARHLLGDDAPYLEERALLDALASRVRHRKWPDQIDTVPHLILEGLCFLPRRPGAAQALSDLVEARVSAGLKTVLTQAGDASSMNTLMEKIPPEQRATVVLRFPVGRGRVRYAARLCDELGIPRTYARLAQDVDPWTYERIRQTLSTARDELNGRA